MGKWKIGIGIGIEIEMGMEMEMHFPIVCGCLVLWHSNTPGQRHSCHIWITKSRVNPNIMVKYKKNMQNILYNSRCLCRKVYKEFCKQFLFKGEL